MGKIITKLTVINHKEELYAEDGKLEPEKVHQIVLDDVLVDTGATTLCLPSKYIKQLDLKKYKTVAVSTVYGTSEKRIYQDVSIKLIERTTVCECIEISDDSQPLLGVIPLEMLGIELDLQSQKLKFLPYDLLSTYITVF